MTDNVVDISSARNRSAPPVLSHVKADGALPCPFCGEIPYISDDMVSAAIIRCYSDPCVGDYANGESTNLSVRVSGNEGELDALKQRAIERWNRRAKT